MGLLGVALGAGEGLVTQLRGSTKRFIKCSGRAPRLGLALPPSAFVSCAHVGTGYLRPLPGPAVLGAPFRCFCSVLQPPAPHTRPFRRSCGGQARPGTPGSGGSNHCPGAAASPYPQDSWSLSLQAGRGVTWAGRPPGSRFSASQPGGRRVWRAEPAASRVGRGADAILFAVRRALGLMAAPGTRGRASLSPRRRRWCWNSRAGWMGAASRRAGATSTGSCAA